MESELETRASFDESVSDHEQLSKLARLTIFTLPIAAAFSRWAYISPGQEQSPYLYRVMVLILFLLAALAMVKGRKQHLAQVAMIVLALLIVAWYLFFKPFDIPDPGLTTTRTGGLLIQIGAVFGTLWLLRGSLVRITIFAKGIAVSAVIMVGIALWEVITGNHLPLLVGQPWLINDLHLPVATFQNPNNLAIYLVCAAAAIIFLFTRQKQKRYRFIYAATLVAIFVVIVQAKSILSLTAYALVVFLAVFFFTETKAGLLVLTPLFGISGLVLLRGLTGISVLDYVNRVFSDDDQGSLSIRRKVSQLAYQEWQEHFWFGASPGAFEWKQQNSLEFVSGTDNVVNAHNTILQFLMEYGLITTLPFLILIGYCLVRLVRFGAVPGFSKGTPMYAALICARLTFLAWIAASLVASSLLIEVTWWQFFAYILCILEYLSIQAKTAEPHPLQVGSAAS